MSIGIVSKFEPKVSSKNKCTNSQLKHTGFRVSKCYLFGRYNLLNIYTIYSSLPITDEKCQTSHLHEE